MPLRLQRWLLHRLRQRHPSPPRRHPKIEPPPTSETKPESPKSSILGKIKEVVVPKQSEERKELATMLQSWVNEAKSEEEKKNFKKAQKKILEAYDTNSSQLNIKYLNLPYLPDDLFSIPRFQENLKELDLSGNQLTCFPREFYSLKYLQKMTLDSNKITEIPTQIAMLDDLTRLYLSSNQITSVPTQIEDLQNLRHLNLADNKLTKLPHQMGNLTSLMTLDLSNNKLTKIPDKIYEISNLCNLMIASNYIQEIPAATRKGLEIYNAPKSSPPKGTQSTPKKSRSAAPLQHTELSADSPDPTAAAAQAEISAAAAEKIKATDGIESEYCGAILKTATIAESAAAAALARAHTAAQAALEAEEFASPTTPTTPLSDKRSPVSSRKRTPGTAHHISTPMYERIKGFIGLESNLERTHLTDALNDWINEPGTDTSMDKEETEARKTAAIRIVEAYDHDGERLSLLGLGLSNIPPGILNNSKFRKNLRFVDLGSNKFDEFPIELLRFENLESLNLMENKISLLPTQIERLTKLKMLDVSFNEIETLPTQIGQLKKLRDLSIGSNKIKKLPTQMGQLTALTHLNISHNEIEKIHDSILELPRLSSFLIGGNRIQNPPKEGPPYIIQDSGQKGKTTEENNRKQRVHKARNEFERMFVRNRKMGW